jgi:hypothetical protein
MNAAHIAELQAAVEGQVVDWRAFPDRPEAHAIGEHGGIGYHLTVRRHAQVWKWTVSGGGGRIRCHHAGTAVDAIYDANAAYARFADEVRYPEAVSA